MDIHQSSEGTSLTQNDEKGYWGKITEVVDGGKDNIEGDPTNWGNKKIEIKGAVMIGWGLEPTTVGRFKMIEIEDVLEDDDVDEEEDEDEEYEEMSADDVMENANNLDSMMTMETSETEVEDSSNPFDMPGAFE